MERGVWQFGEQMNGAGAYLLSLAKIHFPGFAPIPQRTVSQGVQLIERSPVRNGIATATPDGSHAPARPASAPASLHRFADPAAGLADGLADSQEGETSARLSAHAAPCRAPPAWRVE